MEQDSQVENSSQEINVPESQTVQTQTEKPDKMVTISQSKFDEQIRHTAARVANKARQERDAYWQNQMPVQNTSSSGLSAEEVQKIATEAAETKHKELLEFTYKQQLEVEGNRLAQEFMSKLSNADKNLYPNLEENLQNANLAKMADLVALANSIEGTEGIIDELLSNPTKIPSLQALAYQQPQLAQQELSRMAESIKLKHQAKNAKLPREPLHRINSSSVGMDNGSPQTVSDLQRQFRDKSYWR